MKIQATSPRGFVLILSLFFLMILSGVVVAFFFKSMRFSNSGNHFLSLALSEWTAKTAVDKIIGDIRQCIVDQSTITSLDDKNKIYLPKDLVSWSFLQDERLHSNPNLAKVLRISQADSRTAQNQKISASRWNAAQMADFDSTLIPEWIYFEEEKGSSLSNKMGRYSYVLYDLGGTLNVNVAGISPAYDTNNRMEWKGGSAWLDWKILPSYSAQITEFLNWRDAKLSKGGSSLFENDAYSKSLQINEKYIRWNEKEGYLKRLKGTQALFGRKDFIESSKKLLPISEENLRYYTTFSREVNDVVYDPSIYAMGSYSSDTNVPWYQVKAKAPFFRRNGVKAKAGELLLRNRFPLSLISHLSWNGVAAGSTSEDVQKDFGLVWNSSQSRWDYVGSTGNTLQTKIKTLKEVALEDREPNFFELLKLGILNGSLAQYFAFKTNVWDYSNLEDPLADLHIIRIGANLIDQYDSDSYPTIIQFGTTADSGMALGVENLPYFKSVMPVFYRLTNNGNINGTLYTRPYVRSWIQPEIWNPHQNPKSNLLPEQGPTKFRFTMQGGLSVRPYNSNSGAYYTATYLPSTTLPNPAVDSSNGLKFTTLQNDFHDPIVLNNTSICTPGVTGDNFSDGIASIVGFYAGESRAPDATLDAGKPGLATVSSGTILVDINVATIAVAAQTQFLLQYWNGTRWLTYSKRSINRGMNVPEVNAIGQPYTSYVYSNPSFFLYKPSEVGRWYWFDPRSERLGVIWCMGLSRQGAIERQYEALKQPNRPSNWIGLGESGFGCMLSPLSLVINDNKKSATAYTDPDGLNRLGDGAYLSNVTSNGYPVVTTDRSGYSVILDRPFRSVAEMGYAFRDIPYKTLDFMTENSADAGLLDLFSVDDEPSVSAGKLQFNPFDENFISAFIFQTRRSISDESLKINSNDAVSIASKIKESVNGKPLRSRGDWVNHLASKQVNDIFPGIKTQREAIARSVVDSTGFRTWNFMIDVVAQTGVLQKSEKAPHFLVQGESRYWVHVAIDRLTGKIVDTQWEAVVK